MSQQLDVRIVQNVEIAHLRSWCEQALVRLTGSQPVPRVLVERLEAGQLHEVRTTDTLNLTDYYMFSCENHAGSSVGVCVIVVEPVSGYISEDESGPYASMEVHGGAPVACTLAAALAIAVSELCGTAIEDDVLFWSKDRTAWPTQFIANLAVCGENLSFDAACRLLHSRLHRVANSDGLGAAE